MSWTIVVDVAVALTVGLVLLWIERRVRCRRKP